MVSDNRLAELALPLFREYAHKLEQVRIEAAAIEKLFIDSRNRSITQSGVKLSQQIEGETQQSLGMRMGVLRSYFQQLSVAMSKFARQISQRLEHAELGDAEQIVLEMRLAEFESDLSRTEEFLSIVRI
jgi:hypothetical protein